MYEKIINLLMHGQIEMYVFKNIHMQNTCF